MCENTETESKPLMSHKEYVEKIESVHTVSGLKALYESFNQSHGYKFNRYKEIHEQIAKLSEEADDLSGEINGWGEHVPSMIIKKIGKLTLGISESE